MSRRKINDVQSSSSRRWGHQLLDFNCPACSLNEENRHVTQIKLFLISISNEILQSSRSTLSLSLHNTNAETDPPRSGWSDLPLPLTQNIYMCSLVGACSMESFTSFLKVHQTRSMESCTSVLEVHPVINSYDRYFTLPRHPVFLPRCLCKAKVKKHTYIHTYRKNSKPAKFAHDI